MAAYYNEIEPYAAEWIKNLIAAGLVTPGDVDTRSIVDVRPDDLVGYSRCHFFAGIAVWDYALGLAGWPAERPVWTGSCPCQPFSAAGRGGGIADERHLWPHWHHLIRECRPTTIFGEQVASKDGLGWLDLVQADLEGEGYAVGAADLCAAGVGAPHIRQRLWFVADADGIAGGQGRAVNGRGYPRGAQKQRAGSGSSGVPRLMGDASGARSGRDAGAVLSAQGEGAGEWGRAGHQPHQPIAAGAACGLADADVFHERRSTRSADRHGQLAEAWKSDDALGRLRRSGFWSNADWIACRDGKARPVEPGTFPLAHGAPARVGRLRAYGNAICAEAAAAFIGACLEVRP